MIVAGLTGSIGMGKSTAAKMFAEAGAAVCDSDALVHELYAPGGAAIAPIAAAFPGAVRGGAVDRAALSAIVARDGSALQRLEALVHPLVAEAQAAFLERERASGAGLAILEIPLLFETGGEGRVDKVIVVSAPAEAQRARVMARPGMNEEKFQLLLARQIPDAEKRARADFVIDTGGTLEQTRAQVHGVLAKLAEAR
jgi:dephospho-CoA kinase